MYDARAIANFFLDRSASNQAQITVMTLLKVLYFAHAWHMAKYDAPLVAQPFEAWTHGPVVRVVYDQYKKCGDKPITKKAVSFDAKAAAFVETPYEFESDIAEFLSNIFDYYSQFHPFTLSDLTHEKGGPWDLVWSEAATNAVPGMIIPNDRIASWFSRKGALSWTKREQRNLS